MNRRFTRETIYAAGLALTFIIFAIIAYVSWNTTRRMVESSRWVAHTHLILQKLESLHSLVKDAERGERGYVITGDESFLTPYAAARSSVHRELDWIRQLTIDNPKQQKALDLLAPLVEKELSELEKIVTLKRAKGEKAAADAIASGAPKRTMEAIAAVIATMQAEEQHLLTQRARRNEEIADTSAWAIIIGDILALLFMTGTIAVVISDLTHRKRAAGELQLEKERAEQYFDVSGVLMMVVDPDGAITRINRKGCEILGYRETDLIGQSLVQKLIPERVRGEVRKLFLNVMRGDRDVPDYFECPVATAQGEERLIAWHSRALRDTGGELQAVVASGEDITVRRVYEATLVRAKEDAEKASRAKSDFLAGMSHEIRTPLNSIIGMAELLGETRLDETQQNYVRIFRNGAENLLALINDILDMAKVESGFLTLEEIDFSLEELLERTCEMMAVRATAKGLQIRCSRAAGLPQVVAADPVRLRQVLVNLIGNAVKFTDWGGIDIHVSLQQTDEDCGTFHFSVTDTGIGIPPQKLEMIFERFMQVDSSISRKYGGTGLGLSLSRRLVEAMGGTIWADSTPGKGTTFHFTCRMRIPQEAPRIAASYTVPPQRPELPAEEAKPARSLSILLVDDNEDNRLLIENYLRRSPHRLEVVSSGYEALRRVCIEARHYDLILMDVQMPEMDGYSVTGEIRRWENRNGTPPVLIVALTAHALREDEQRSLAAGCNGHLNKPIKKPQLLEALEKYAWIAEQQREAAAS